MTEIEIKTSYINLENLNLLNSEKLKKEIQKMANVHFPAEELWFKEPKTFWAFELQENIIYTTYGECMFDKIFYTTYKVENTNETLTFLSDIKDEMISENTKKGYECFGIQI